MPPVTGTGRWAGGAAVAGAAGRSALSKTWPPPTRKPPATTAAAASVPVNHTSARRIASPKLV